MRAIEPELRSGGARTEIPTLISSSPGGSAARLPHRLINTDKLGPTRGVPATRRALARRHDCHVETMNANWSRFRPPAMSSFRSRRTSCEMIPSLGTEWWSHSLNRELAVG